LARFVCSRASVALIAASSVAAADGWSLGWEGDVFEQATTPTVTRLKAKAFLHLWTKCMRFSFGAREWLCPGLGTTHLVQLVRPNVRDQRRRAVGAPLADQNLWMPLAVLASGVTTRDDRCIA
jgi:hypothetical protein